MIRSAPGGDRAASPTARPDRRVLRAGSVALVVGALVAWRAVSAGRPARPLSGPDAHRLPELGRLYEAAPIGMGVVDVQGRYLRVNPVLAAYFGVAPDAPIGRTTQELAPGVAPAVQPHFEAVLASRRTVRFELTGESPSRPGDVRTWRVGFYPLFDAAGRLAAVGGVIDDITDLRRAQTALQEADRRKDEFLATLAHELRTPLAPLRTGLRVLQKAPPGSEAARATFDMMSRQLSHTLRLVDDLLDVSRISRGKLAMRRERVALADIAAAALDACRPAIEDAGHALRMRPSREPLHVIGDADRLVQALGNLLANAAKYTPDGGTITVTLRRERQSAVVEVRDTGVGIAPERLPRIFGLYTQLGETLDRAQGGLGIGLSLVKSIVELHGGTVRASSPGPGHGSAFAIVLPAASMRGSDYGAG